MEKTLHFLKTILLVIFWLFIFDIFLQIMLSTTFFKDTKIDKYFNYGLSVETQLRNMVESELPPNSVLKAGWFNRELNISKGEVSDITIYGMSFSNHISTQIKKIEQDITIRTISGPAAPLNHSYYAYQVDKHLDQSDIIILGILDSSIKNIAAMTNDTMGVDSPYGSFYPRYKLEGAILKPELSAINSFQELKDSLSDNLLWEKQLDILQENDSHYSKVIYCSNFLDLSIIGRLIKRWYKIRHNNVISNQIHDNNGFDNNSDSIKIANQIVKNFAQEVRADESIPIILLFHTQGFSTHIYDALKDTLNIYNIDYVSTDKIFSTTDPQNFLPDGHFTEKNDEKIAQEVLNLIYHYDVLK